MGFVRDLFGKEPALVTLQDIDDLISAKKEEDRFLEYKDPRILGEPEKLSAWVSSFLNADGGLIILGVCEDDPRKKEKISARIVPVRRDFVPRGYPKERIEQIIFSHILSSSKPEIVVYPVRDAADVNNALYLVEVPQGDNPPYQAFDGKYYRRLNATKYAMPHSEIADFFGARRKPKLSLMFQIMEVDVQDWSFTIRAFVANVGKVVARYTMVIASFVNVEILNTTSGHATRIDDLRGNLPCLQWEYPTGVIHPTGARSRFLDVKLKVRNPLEAAQIRAEFVAQDTDLSSDTYVIHLTDLQQADEVIGQGGQVHLVPER